MSYLQMTSLTLLLIIFMNLARLLILSMKSLGLIIQVAEEEAYIEVGASNAQRLHEAPGPVVDHLVLAVVVHAEDEKGRSSRPRQSRNQRAPRRHPRSPRGPCSTHPSLLPLLTLHEQPLLVGASACSTKQSPTGRSSPRCTWSRS